MCDCCILTSFPLSNLEEGGVRSLSCKGVRRSRDAGKCPIHKRFEQIADSMTVQRDCCEVH
jgi:hypothetical protein